MLRSKSLPHVDLKRFKLLKQASNSSQLSQVIKYFEKLNLENDTTNIIQHKYNTNIYNSSTAVQNM